MLAALRRLTVLQMACVFGDAHTKQVVDMFLSNRLDPGQADRLRVELDKAADRIFRK